MDISQTNDNELQKAIDDITSNAATDGANDAVSELEAKIQNQLGVPPVPPMPDIPGLGEVEAGVAAGTPGAAVAPEVAPAAGDEALQAATAAVDAAEVASAAVAGSVPTPEAMAIPEAPVASEAVNEAPVAVEMSASAPVAEVATPVTPEANGDLQGVKVAMMHDLFPLMDKVNVQPEQKYEIYKEMLDTTSDKSMIAAAYEAAKGIADETARAEALLYLIETIDK